jgi:transcriptional regulator with XRE-family HTH domain
MNISSKIKELRELRRFTQADLGERAGMGAASISHFETGQRTPSLDSLVRLADALDVTADVLLGRAVEGTQPALDPIFLRASQADARTLATVKRVTAALLDGIA